MKLNDDVIDYLIERIKTLRAENEQLRVGQQGNERVIEASEEVARMQLFPFRARPDLDTHALGRKLVGKVKLDKVDDVRQMLEEKPAVVSWRACHSGKGRTLLHEAAAAGAVNVCRFLLEGNYIDPRATDLMGKTALHVAAEALNADVCQLLVTYMKDAKGESAPQDSSGLTPAGCSALKAGTSEKAVTQRKRCTELLHEVGDACISPMVAPSSRRRGAKTGSVRRSSMLRDTVITGATPEAPEALSISHGHSSMPGFRVTMEDAVTLCEHVPGTNSLALFAVFDGHGGRGAADFAARNILSIFENLPQVKSGIAVQDPQALQAALEETCWQLDEVMSKEAQFAVHEVVVREAMGDEERKVAHKAEDNSGTTCVLGVVSPSHIAVANVGDSRAVLAKRPGATIPMSRDHKPPRPDDTDPFAMAEAERIRLAGGSVDDEGHYVQFNPELKSDKLGMSRTLGNFVAKQNKALPRDQQIVTAQAEVRVVPRSPDDEFLLLACDGIWDVMNNESAVQFVRQQLSSNNSSSSSNDLNVVCRKLLLRCLELESQDNMTAVVVQLKQINRDLMQELNAAV